MSLQRQRGILMIAVLCAAGSFLATYALQPQQQTVPPREGGFPSTIRTLGGWLQLTPEQAARLADIEPEFAHDSAELEAVLSGEREKLAELFEDEQAHDDQILEQVERVIEAQGALERRVTAYLVAIRSHLSDAQRTKLFKRCADGVRRAGGWRWRHQRGDPGADQSVRGAGKGGGRGPGRGDGSGRGRGNQFGRQRDRTAADEPTSRPQSQPDGDRP